MLTQLVHLLGLRQILATATLITIRLATRIQIARLSTIVQVITVIVVLIRHARTLVRRPTTVHATFIIILQVITRKTARQSTTAPQKTVDAVTIPDACLQGQTPTLAHVFQPTMFSSIMFRVPWQVRVRLTMVAACKSVMFPALDLKYAHVYPDLNSIAI